MGFEEEGVKRGIGLFMVQVTKKIKIFEECQHGRIDGPEVVLSVWTLLSEIQPEDRRFTKVLLERFYT